MNIGSKEHYDILAQFEREFTWLNIDRENKEMWSKGNVYNNGYTNQLYQAYIHGYSFGKAQYQQ